MFAFCSTSSMATPEAWTRWIGSKVRSTSSGDRLMDALEVLGALGTVAAEVGAHLQVLADGHGREHAPVLGHDRHAPGDPVAGRAGGDVLPVEYHPAIAGPHQAERGL